MTSNRPSKLPAATAAVAVGLVVLATGIAGAVTVEEREVPSAAEVGTTVTASFTLQDLYGQYDQWTLVGSTGLDNATWTVVENASGTAGTENRSGRPPGESSSHGSSFEYPIGGDEDVTEVRVEITGRVPGITNWSYGSGQSFVLAEFRRGRRNGTSTPIETIETRHYTEESSEARRAIDDARAAVESAGGNGRAETTLRNAISAYNAGDFDAAVGLAEDAERAARNATRRRQHSPTVATADGEGMSGTGGSAGDTDGRDNGDATRRGFFSNTGDEPGFLSNAFSLTILGFLLSVVGIIHQLLRGR